MNADEFLKQTRVPLPPAELRARVLAHALNRNETQKSLLDRVWDSRLLRLGWGATVVCLVMFLHFWNPPVPEMTPKQAVVDNELDPDLTQIYYHRVNESRYASLDRRTIWHEALL